MPSLIPDTPILHIDTTRPEWFMRMKIDEETHEFKIGFQKSNLDDELIVVYLFAYVNKTGFAPIVEWHRKCCEYISGVNEAPYIDIELEELNMEGKSFSKYKLYKCLNYKIDCSGPDKNYDFVSIELGLKYETMEQLY